MRTALRPTATRASCARTLGQQVAHAVLHRTRIGKAGLGIDEGLRFGQRIERRIGEQLVGQGLQARLARDRALRAALDLERRIQVFEFLLRRRRIERRCQLGRQLALLGHALDHGRTPLFELTQIGQPRFEFAQLHIVQTLGGLLAVARDEGHRRATVEQRDRSLDLRRAGLQLGGELEGDFRLHMVCGRCGHQSKVVKKTKGGSVAYRDHSRCPWSYGSPMAQPTEQPLQSLRAKGFDIRFVSHAAGILVQDFPHALVELEAALSNLELPITEIIGSGGGETKFTQRLRKTLAAMHWPKHVFEIAKTVDGVQKESTSHEIDHVRRFDNGVVALEIEWNNKDPFFDRDLENFKRLHAEGAISVGVLVTRGSTLQEKLKAAVRKFAADRNIVSFDALANNGYVPTPKQRANVLKRVERKKEPLPFADAWTDNFVSNKYGQATTHWDKLMDRVQRGVGNPCPIRYCRGRRARRRRPQSVTNKSRGWPTCWREWLP
jgi:hypothetical protein